MTQWTPELEQLVEQYADVIKSSQQDMINPRSSITGSFMRAAFKTVIKADRLYKKICIEAGLNPPTGLNPKYDQLPAIIALAQENNSALADKLRKNEAVFDQIEEIIGNPRLRDGFAPFKAMKQAGIKY